MSLFRRKKYRSPVSNAELQCWLLNWFSEDDAEVILLHHRERAVYTMQSRYTKVLFNLIQIVEQDKKEGWAHE